MSIDPALELVQFHQFIVEHMNKGSSMSPEEAVDLWRASHPDPATYEEDVEAVREALAELDAGEPGMTIEEFAAEIRNRHGISEGE